MKKKVIPLLLLSLFLFTGCKEQTPVPDATATPEPIGLNVFNASSANTGLASKLNAVCAPFERILTNVAGLNCNVIDYCIPGQILADAGSDAVNAGATVVNGKYTFSVDKGGDFSYTVWGQDIIEAMQTPVPDNYDYTEQISDHMEYVYSDTQNEGGGLFSTRYVYDIAEDGKSGAIEIYSTLDGQINGHERFDYVISDGVLCFTDAALDACNIAEGNYPYIIVCGAISADELYTINYTVQCSSVGVPKSYPSVNTLSLNTIFNASTIENSLSVRDGKATEAYQGNFNTYSLR